jgi:hypothetical protein
MFFFWELRVFFNDFGSEMVLSVFPAFFTSVLKSGAGALGLVEGLADGAANIIKIYAGRYSDTLQKRKPFIVAGYTLSTLTRPLYMLTSSVGGVLGLRFADRIGKGLRDAPRDAIISLSTSPAQMGQAFGFHRMLDTLGGIAGPLAAYFILRAYPGGFNIVFVSAFVVGLCAVASLFFIKDIVGQSGGRDISLQSVATFPPTFRRYLVALFLLAVGSMPVAVLLLVTQRLGFSLYGLQCFVRFVFNVGWACKRPPRRTGSVAVGVRVSPCRICIHTFCPRSMGAWRRIFCPRAFPCTYGRGCPRTRVRAFAGVKAGRGVRTRECSNGLWAYGGRGRRWLSLGACGAGCRARCCRMFCGHRYCRTVVNQTEVKFINRLARKGLLAGADLVY